MPLSVRELRRKIQAIRRIQQITNAMRLVSAARLQRAQAHLRRIRPYCEELVSMLEGAMKDVGPILGPFVKGNGVKRVAVWVVASDRGLCGGYNMAVLEKFEELAKEVGEVLVVAMGRRLIRELRKRPYRVVEEFDNPHVTPTLEEALPVARRLLSLFVTREVGEVWAVYAKFVSAGRFYPFSERLLPFEPPKVEPRGLGLYEPGAREFLQTLAPRVFEAQVFRCLAEAQTSEQAARMLAMAQATDNAQELIESLTVEMNKARQATITAEVSDITRAAEVMARGR